LEKAVKKTISFQNVGFLTSILTKGLQSCEKVSGRTDDSLFLNFTQSSSDRRSKTPIEAIFGKPSPCADCLTARSAIFLLFLLF